MAAMAPCGYDAGMATEDDRAAEDAQRAAHPPFADRVDALRRATVALLRDLRSQGSTIAEWPKES